MKLIRHGRADQEKPGVLHADTAYDCSALFNDYDRDFFAAPASLDKIRTALENDELPKVSTERLGPPLARPGKIICIGLNYGLHAKESGMDVPTEPVVFFKASSAITGPYDNIIIPKDSRKTDWEVELAVVVGKAASYVDEADAMDHVAGYLIHNDVSERAYQLEMGGQWVKGKSCDAFAPLGPWLVTADEVADPHKLRLWLKLNGETLQDSTTADLIYNIPHLISYLSRFMTLEPGDVISTGTPSGVGLGLDPPRYLQPGDVVELGIDGLGVARQEAIAYDGR